MSHVYFSGRVGEHFKKVVFFSVGFLCDPKQIGLFQKSCHFDSMAFGSYFPPIICLSTSRHRNLFQPESLDSAPKNLGGPNDEIRIRAGRDAMRKFSPNRVFSCHTMTQNSKLDLTMSGTCPADSLTAALMRSAGTRERLDGFEALAEYSGSIPSVFHPCVEESG
jgi:hypothetical protein